MRRASVGRLSLKRTTWTFFVGWPKEPGLEGFKGVNPALLGPLEAAAGGACPRRAGVISGSALGRAAWPFRRDARLQLYCIVSLDIHLPTLASFPVALL